jgi:ATP-dependent DNA helicase RecQ
LAAHLGETMEEPCGCCSACRGDGPHEVPRPRPRSIGTSALTTIERLAGEFPDRFTSPRDRARFLCGLSSPSMVRARLTRDPSFGICQDLPFAEVLKQLGP